MEPQPHRSRIDSRTRASTLASTSPTSREEAGARLAERLSQYRGTHAAVLGIARGGVPVAAPIARLLEAELDVIVARRLIVPGTIESVGAVTADGSRFLNTGHIADAGVSSASLHRVTAFETAAASRSEEFFRDGRSAITIHWRQVILVDDGLDSGATIRVALRSIRAQDPARITVAIPVGSRRGCAAVRDEVDELVCLEERDPALGISVHQRDPTTATDAELRHLLAEGRF